MLKRAVSGGPYVRVAAVAAPFALSGADGAADKVTQMAQLFSGLGGGVEVVDLAECVERESDLVLRSGILSPQVAVSQRRSAFPWIDCPSAIEASLPGWAPILHWHS